MVCIKSLTICSLRHPLGTLEHIHTRVKGQQGMAVSPFHLCHLGCPFSDLVASVGSVLTCYSGKERKVV